MEQVETKGRFLKSLGVLVDMYKKDVHALPPEDRGDLFQEGLILINEVTGLKMGPRLSLSERSITPSIFISDELANVSKKTENSTGDGTEANASGGTDNTGGVEKDIGANKD